MLEAMFCAEVGDDVFGDDPTVNRLEAMAADLLGQEAGLYTPSGTMANQVALRTWTEPGQEVILDRWSHAYVYEVGCGAAVSGLSFWPIDTADGMLSPDEVEPVIRPDNLHHTVTRIVSVENTHNRHGGAVYPLERIRDLRELTQRRGLILHMDGARVCNAAVAAGLTPTDYGSLCDSITLCLSKGLGCPVGSLLAGPKDFIVRARRFRKMFGGGMRQAGYLAAAGIYALEHHVDRLAEDHANARRLAEGLAHVDGLRIDLGRVVTNMVYATFEEGPDRAKAVMDAAAQAGVHALLLKPDTARLVLHLDVSADDVDKAIDVLRRLMA